MKKLITFSMFILLNNNLNVFGQCFTSISASHSNVAARKDNGSFWVWGNGVVGQIGNGQEQDVFSPLNVTNLTDWKKIICGRYNTFAIKNNNTLWATGGNLHGGLGLGSSTILGVTTFTQIGTATNWKEVVSNSLHTLAIKTDGTIWGTGQNDMYQMGNGTCCANQLSFMQIGTATDWKAVATSETRASFALKTNGTLWAWGGNINYLLGDSSISTITVPTPLFPTNTDFDKISVGFGHGLLLKTNGTLWGWGGANNGETGYPIGTVFGFELNQIPGAWSSMAAGFRMSFGIKTDGTLWGWGLNDVGQLGNGSTTTTHIPTQIGTANNYVSVGCGYQHGVALRADGSLWAWGNNDYGQLGDGTGVSKTTPINVPVTGCELGNEDFVKVKNTVILSPNPSSNLLSINYKGNDNIDEIVIYDTLGRSVYTNAALGNNVFSTIFSIENLQNGVYVVSLKNKDKKIIQKQFIKE